MRGSRATLDKINHTSPRKQYTKQRARKKQKEYAWGRSSSLRPCLISFFRPFLARVTPRLTLARPPSQGLEGRLQEPTALQDTTVHGPVRATRGNGRHDSWTTSDAPQPRLYSMPPAKLDQPLKKRGLCKEGGALGRALATPARLELPRPSPVLKSSFSKPPLSPAERSRPMSHRAAMEACRVAGKKLETIDGPHRRPSLYY